MTADPRVELLARELYAIRAEDSALACGRSKAQAKAAGVRGWTDYAEFMREAHREDARRLLRVLDTAA